MEKVKPNKNRFKPNLKNWNLMPFFNEILLFSRQFFFFSHFLRLFHLDNLIYTISHISVLFCGFGWNKNINTKAVLLLIENSDQGFPVKFDKG